MSGTQFESIISQIVADSPSGEIKKVYDDLIAIAGQSSKETILDAIEQYNIENLVPVEAGGTPVIISKYNKEGSKFFDPVRAISFSVDHLVRESFDVQPHQSTQLSQSQQDILNKLQNYADKNFPGELTTAVYPIPDANCKSAILIVSTKYNPSNFWNGQWKSEYIFDSDAKTLEGSIDVQVHYYEDGNVSFKSSKNYEMNEVTDVIKSIEQVEKDFENTLDFSFTELNEKQFKNLRRRLPITRSKVNWGKAIGNYRLGKDVAQGRQQ